MWAAPVPRGGGRPAPGTVRTTKAAPLWSTPRRARGRRSRRKSSPVRRRPHQHGDETSPDIRLGALTAIRHRRSQAPSGNTLRDGGPPRRARRFRSSGPWHRRGSFPADEIQPSTVPRFLRPVTCQSAPRCGWRFLPRSCRQPSPPAPRPKRMGRRTSRGGAAVRAPLRSGVDSSNRVSRAVSDVSAVRCDGRWPTGQSDRAVPRLPGDPQCRGPGRCELNGERYAVEVATDRCDRRQVLRLRRVVRSGFRCSGDEKRHCAVPQNSDPVPPLPRLARRAAEREKCTRLRSARLPGWLPISWRPGTGAR